MSTKAGEIKSIRKHSQFLNLGRSTQEHWCYFRDSPSEVPIMVVHNKPLDHGKYRNAGDTVFAMLLAECDHCEDRRAGKALKAQLKSLAEQKGIDLSLNKSKRKRDLEINGSTFSNLGIRVPYDEASKVGYRSAHLCLASLFLFHFSKWTNL